MSSFQEFLADVKVGDILYTSWGYDQTNIEFFKVTKHTGKSLTISQIPAKIVPSGHMSGLASPDETQVGGAPINAKSRRSKHFHGSLHKYDGKALYCSWYH